MEYYIDQFCVKVEMQGQGIGSCSRKMIIWRRLLSRVEYKYMEKCQKKYGKIGILN